VTIINGKQVSPASSTATGVVTTGVQTFAGRKTLERPSEIATGVICFENIPINTPVHQFMNGATRNIRVANNTLYPAHGVSTEAGTAGAACIFMRKGSINIPGLTYGNDYYLGAAGSITNTPDYSLGKIVQKLGTCTFNNWLDLNTFESPPKYRNATATALQGINSTTGNETLLPFPSAPLSGQAYNFSYLGNNEWGWSLSYTPPPLTTFFAGWVDYPWSRVAEVIDVGAFHAAVSIGSVATVSSRTFEATPGGGADTDISGVWSGTNWNFVANNATYNPDGRGNNIARTESTPWPNGNDPSLGTLAGVSALCSVSMRRNFVLTISGLTIGKKYYIIILYWGYPGTTTLTSMVPYVGTTKSGSAEIFAFDGGGMSLATGVRRYGFVATATSQKISKFGPDVSGSYIVGALCTDQGV
jgi:hypothetical protein